jgi:outer membrane protein assembly factor BamB
MKYSARLILICVLSLLVAACGKSKKTDFFGEEEKPVKPKIETVTKLKRNWSVSLGSKISEGDAIISPALLGESVYAASTNGKITKIEAGTGKRQWQTVLKKEKITAGVSVGGGLVLVATDQGVVYALNQSDGVIAWQSKLSSEILASPVIGGDIVVARTGDGKVYGLSSFNGEIQWTISRQLPKLTLRGDSKPLIFQNVVFAGFSDGTLAALEAKNGRALWDFPISFPRGSNEIDRLADVDTDPLLVGDYIYVSSYQEITHALNIAEQRIEWSVDVSSFHSLAYDAAFLYISDKQGVVHQVERSNGNKSWSQEGLRVFNISAPISVGPYVVVADGKGLVYVMNKTDGSYAGRHKIGADTILGSPLVDSDTFIFIDSSGKLQSLSLINK